MTIRSFFAGQDDGPRTFGLEQVRTAISPTGSAPKDFNERILAFRMDQVKVVELARLVSRVQAKADDEPAFKRWAITKSVAAWVHATNKIEFSGMKELHETEAAIMAGLTGNSEPSRAEREVLQIWELVRDTYTAEVLNHPKPVTVLSVDTEKFKLYHRILMNQILHSWTVS
ncbi:hypothetical protein HDU76_003597 [Blyttiomyces sp. JEL0837]|nr:hypothetical protein HDU76_003597 [Blyttiomyces sp. JEL0837]